jgi:phthalate 4,5-dioxygenase oxygenase subunit
MLTKEENTLLTQTGPGTRMGDYMRRYWVPALLSFELPATDCPPVRVKLLGEDLIAFRDTHGQVGLLAANCPHRGASLFFGRNEESGLRCVYHGWKFDVTGQCVDMPSEPAESNFKAKIRATTYPCQERGGLIYTYMGPVDVMPALPELEWHDVPEPQRFHSKRMQECNWLQAMEGGIDSSHISFLHGGQPPSRREPPPSVAGRVETAGHDIRRRDTAPKFEVIETDYGMMIGARRNADENTYYWRITQWLMPWYSMIPPFGESSIGGHAWVPIDDEHCWTWSFNWHPARPHEDDELAMMQAGGGIHSKEIPGTFRPAANRDNDYLIDREKQRLQNFTGILGISAQDCAVQESMGTIYDRSRERLGSSDTAIIAARRRLLDALDGMQRGEEPPALDAEGFRVRSFATLLPKDVPFDIGAKEGLIAAPGSYLASV